MHQLLLESIWLVPCYPLIGGLGALYWSPGVTRRTGPRPAGYLNALLTLIAFVHSFWALVGIWDQPPFTFSIPWLQVAGLDLSIPVIASATTVGACVLVIGLNLLAQIYAIGYLEMDWGWARFYSLLGLFEGGMCALVLCDSLFFSYMVLEILTLGTYMLIGYWFNQSLVVTGARDAFLTKRVGDLFLLMGVLAIFPLAGSWDFPALASWAETTTADPTLIALVGLALLVGPMGKCAQFPLHLWLDEAMEGPIPSTILRNSVVVATGAWVLIKLEPVLTLSPLVRSAMIAVGLISALGGTLVALAQIDAKRVLSYTTTAYMGLIFITVGSDQSGLALQFLLTYALGMALLVMSCGTVIWNSITQDLRFLGGLWSRRPLSGLAFLLGTATLVALPPLGGSWGLLQLTDVLWREQNWLAWMVILVNGLMTVALLRMFGLIFAGSPKQMTERSPEVHWPMMVPMMLLFGLTLHVPHILIQWQLLPELTILLQPSSVLLVGIVGLGIVTGTVLYLTPAIPKPIRLTRFEDLQDLLANDFYTPILYRTTIVGLVGVISRLADFIDRYLVDGLVNLVGLASTFGGQTLKYTVSGQAQLYLLAVLLGSILLALIIFST
ncbi:MAG: NAD(P)H-quinone oxidoreductase subunit F [Synechococcaceae cyanobacterium SM2_3_1]|nr:NAD(P)H-quinone oxidoreductase subunit F [Synechococcaceae cyanobacterium SM2_3_1]